MRSKAITIKFIATVFIISFTIILWGCVGGQEDEPVLTVAAASDLQLAFREIGQLFTEKTKIPVQFNFGSTGLLTQQVANGAPIDVLAAANIAYVNSLEERGLIIPETKTIYSRGYIVLVTKQQNLAIDFWESLQQGQWQQMTLGNYKNLAIANPEHAPYGTAAKEFLITTENWDNIQEKIVYGTNVRDALNFVNSGNAELGIVALSIIDDSLDLDYILVPEELHEPLNQAMAVVKATKMEQEAMAFSNLVVSEEGRAILRKYGFAIPEEGDI